tara:strand:+ start:1538 stop:1981 length:444 start_codon:yes stop_codon:yes gene_type:complete
MKFVVDSNVLFTFFWKNSVFNKIILHYDLNLYSPEFALGEIKKYSLEIRKKTKLSTAEFNLLREKLLETVTFVPIGVYKEKFTKSEEFIKDLDQNEASSLLEDIDFLALSLELNCPLWTNDRLLKKQNLVKILTTSEIIEVLDLAVL